jgi:hypothetical protein
VFLHPNGLIIIGFLTFVQVDAVTRTSVTLSVKQRIAEGLSRAGTSNTLKVVSYNSILGIIAVFAAGAIRQFCVFAIVVLVAHWFLAHTFFITVLSIDIQRLEVGLIQTSAFQKLMSSWQLEEVLRQNPSMNLVPNSVTKTDSPQPASSWDSLLFHVKRLLSGRPMKNLSLVLVSHLEFNVGPIDA